MRVKLQHLKKIFQDQTVLDINCLVLETGKIYAVIGPNGSGKTTLLRIIAGIDRADFGNIDYDGIAKPNSGQIAYMPQSTYLFDTSVLANVSLGIKNSKVDAAVTQVRAEYALAQVGMEKFKHCKARSLSGGEAQRVALARTLVLERSLILLDEPASATDISGTERVEQYIKATHENGGATIALTTHNPSQAARIADQVLMMQGGQVVEQGAPSQIFNAPRQQETIHFLKSWRL